MRTVVAISETGSLSKAADRLGLSQPAVSAQIKRLQSLVGGEMFIRTANGTTPTELGRLVIQQARRMLDANDQLFFLGGTRAGQSPIRVGLSSIFAGIFLEKQTSPLLRDTFIHADHSGIIRKGLTAGYIDIGCFFDNSPTHNTSDCTILKETEWPFQWVRARDFVLSPGSPIPIVTLPEDDWMIRPLSDNGLSFRIVFHSPDLYSRLCAVRAGIGLSALPTHMIPPDLTEAKEYYLPRLRPSKALICTRIGIEHQKVTHILQLLMQLCLLEDSVAVGIR